MDEHRTRTGRASAEAPAERSVRTDAWSPPLGDEERLWRDRVERDMRPLLERCERLRDRGLLD